MLTKTSFHQFLDQHKIKYSPRVETHFRTDASFLTLGRPFGVVFPKDESEIVALVDYAVKHQLAITPRAMGSGTAGACLAGENGLIVVVDRLGVCDQWGVRLRNPVAEIVDPDLNPTRIRENDTRELYAIVGAGMTTDELDTFLQPHNYHTAVVPSSGWSSIGGNFSTNAGGNGTPTYGTFKDVVGYIRLVINHHGKAATTEITDREELRKIGGSQGTLGVITRVGVLIVPNVDDGDMANVVLSCESDDIVMLGGTMGRLMEAAQMKCSFLNAEFLFIDPLLFKKDDPLRADQELSEFLNVGEGKRKMLLLYQGPKTGMTNLKGIVSRVAGVAYKEISLAGMKKMLKVRKDSTGLSTGRVAIPGFEDIFITQPSKLGVVLHKIFDMCRGRLPGRPIGHQYMNGIVIHYRPQALVTKEEYAEAWELNANLTAEIIGNKKYDTIKRMEHGLGLELFKLSDERRKQDLAELKQKYDPANLFNPHLFNPDPEICYIGERFCI